MALWAPGPTGSRALRIRTRASAVGGSRLGKRPDLLGRCPVFLNSQVFDSLIGTPAVAGMRESGLAWAEREFRLSRPRPGQAIVSSSGV